MPVTGFLLSIDRLPIYYLGRSVFLQLNPLFSRQTYLSKLSFEGFGWGTRLKLYVHFYSNFGKIICISLALFALIAFTDLLFLTFLSRYLNLCSCIPHQISYNFFVIKSSFLLSDVKFIFSPNSPPDFSHRILVLISSYKPFFRYFRCSKKKSSANYFFI